MFKSLTKLLVIKTEQKTDPILNLHVTLCITNDSPKEPIHNDEESGMKLVYIRQF